MAGPAEHSDAARGEAKPLAIFALGWTLLNGRTLHHVARQFGIWEDVRPLLAEADAEGADAQRPLEDVARRLEGVEIDAVRDAVQDIFIRPQGGDAVRDLGQLGFAVGVASGTLHPATDRARSAFDLDFAEGVTLETTEAGVITGKLAASRYTGDCGRLLCTRAVLEAKRTELAAPFTVAIGDAPGDACMLKAADLGIAIGRAGEAAEQAADVVCPLTEVPERVKAHVDELGIEVLPRR